MGGEVEGVSSGVTFGKGVVVVVWVSGGMTWGVTGRGVVVVVGNEGVVVVLTVCVVVSSKGKPGMKGGGGMKVNKSGVVSRGVSGRR